MEGKNHRRVAIGSREHQEEFVIEKVSGLDSTGRVPQIQRMACYTAFTFDVRHHWTYFLRTVPRIYLGHENATSFILFHIFASEYPNIEKGLNFGIQTNECSNLTKPDILCQQIRAAMSLPQIKSVTKQECSVFVNMDFISLASTMGSGYGSNAIMDSTLLPLCYIPVLTCAEHYSHSHISHCSRVLLHFFRALAASYVLYNRTEHSQGFSIC